jgi:hypothetical protein
VIVNISVTSGTQQGGVPEFSPQNFTVAEEQHVTLVIDNTDTCPHELVIPALNVTTGILQGDRQ